MHHLQLFFFLDINIRFDFYVEGLEDTFAL